MLKAFGLSATIIGVMASVLTTDGRRRDHSDLVVGYLLFMHRERWMFRGLLRRLSLVGLVGAVFFVIYGVAIGKTHPSTMIELPGWIRDSDIMRAFVTLLIYVSGPVAALVNSITIAPGPEYSSSVLYPLMKVLQVLGFHVGDLRYGLPFIAVPFPINTYTFLGPGFWIGGWAGAVIYTSVVSAVIVSVERLTVRRNGILDAFLFGYFVAAVTMSLSSDYFFSMGFSYLVYSLYFVHFLRTRNG